MTPGTNKGKLQLKKQAISNLSARELAGFKGGNEAWTTSKRSCTGIFCCDPAPTTTCACTSTAPTPTCLCVTFECPTVE